MNTLFPGRPHYTGPKQGWFALLHHDCLFESSPDVTERVEYVQVYKPKNEVSVRLRNMLYLGDCPALIKRAALAAAYDAECDVLDVAYDAKGIPLNAAYVAKRAALYTVYVAKRVALDAALDAEILAYLKAWIPDCPWNGKTLVFTTET